MDEMEKKLEADIITESDILHRIDLSKAWDYILDALEEDPETLKIPRQTIPSISDKDFHEHCESLLHTTNFKVIRNKIFKVYTELKESDLAEIKQFIEIAPFITQCRLKSIEQKFNDSNIITDNLRSIRKHAFSYMFNHLIGKELHEGNKFQTTLYDHLTLDRLGEYIKEDGPGTRMSFIYNIYKYMIKRTVDNYNEFTSKRVGGSVPFPDYEDEDEDEEPKDSKDPKDPKKKDKKGKVQKMSDGELDNEIEYLKDLFHQFNEYLFAIRTGGLADPSDDDEYTTSIGCQD